MDLLLSTQSDTLETEKRFKSELKKQIHYCQSSVCPGVGATTLCDQINNVR